MAVFNIRLAGGRGNPGVYVSLLLPRPLPLLFCRVLKLRTLTTAVRRPRCWHREGVTGSWSSSWRPGTLPAYGTGGEGRGGGREGEGRGGEGRGGDTGPCGIGPPCDFCFLSLPSYTLLSSLPPSLPPSLLPFLSPSSLSPPFSFSLSPLPPPPPSPYNFCCCTLSGLLRFAGPFSLGLPIAATSVSSSSSVACSSGLIPCTLLR